MINGFANMLTLGNFLCGIQAIYFTIQDKPLFAAYMILAAMIFDFLDGKIARLTKTASGLGSQLDSLADLVSCGIAPTVLVYALFLKEYDKAQWLPGFLFAACGMIRLARYNINIKYRKSDFFSGLPIPAAAGLVVSFTLVFLSFKKTALLSFIPLVMVIAAVLMVSKIKYPGFLKTSLERKLFIPAVLLSAIFFRYVYFILLWYFIGYALSGIVLEIKDKIYR